MGRPRQNNLKRDKTTGRSRGEHPDDIKAVAWGARVRQGIPVEDMKNELSGYCLGRLLLAGRQKDPAGIVESQHDAGISYASLVRRYDSMVMGRSGDVRAINFNRGAGQSLALDPDPEFIANLRKKYCDCYDALIAEGMVPDERGRVEGVMIAKQTYDVCLDRIMYGTLIRDPHMLGNVRAGLNVLSRVLRYWS
jgi:hypothetical protein